MTADECLKCTYADDSDWDGSMQPLRCRRYPPVLVQRIGHNGLDFVHAYPEVLATDWCGEFKQQVVRVKRSHEPSQC